MSLILMMGLRSFGPAQFKHRGGKFNLHIFKGEKKFFCFRRRAFFPFKFVRWFLTTRTNDSYWLCWQAQMIHLRGESSTCCDSTSSKAIHYFRWLLNDNRFWQNVLERDLFLELQTSSSRFLEEKWWRINPDGFCQCDYATNDWKSCRKTCRQSRILKWIRITMHVWEGS